MTHEETADTPEPVGAEPPTQSVRYEFTTDQNALLSLLARQMRFVGMFLLGLGVIAGLWGISRKSPLVVVYGLAGLFVGLWTGRAGGQFGSVVSTQGSDIPHLMAALNELRKLYTFQYWVCLVALVSLVLTLMTRPTF